MWRSEHLSRILNHVNYRAGSSSQNPSYFVFMDSENLNSRKLTSNNNAIREKALARGIDIRFYQRHECGVISDNPNAADVKIIYDIGYEYALNRDAKFLIYTRDNFGKAVQDMFSSHVKLMGSLEAEFDKDWAEKFGTDKIMNFSEHIQGSIRPSSKEDCEKIRHQRNVGPGGAQRRFKRKLQYEIPYFNQMKEHFFSDRFSECKDLDCLNRLGAIEHCSKEFAKPGGMERTFFEHDRMTTCNYIVLLHDPNDKENIHMVAVTRGVVTNFMPPSTTYQTKDLKEDDYRDFFSNVIPSTRIMSIYRVQDVSEEQNH